MKVDKISIFVEIDGKPYVALLAEENIELIVDVLGSVCKHGVLRVTALPKDYKFEPLGQHLTT
jgi:hypothetical protein